MFKQYKKTLIAASVLTLLPVVIGLLLWNKLPDQILHILGLIMRQTDGAVNLWQYLGCLCFFWRLNISARFLQMQIPKRKISIRS